MLQRRSGLSRPVLKWMSQVMASLGATLAATAIWSAVPHAGLVPQAELTSGGKFAGRALEAVAYDGLDAMPLPRIAAGPGAAAPRPPPAPTRASPEAAPAPQSAWPARAPRPTHAVFRLEPRRPPPPEKPSPRAIAPFDIAIPAGTASARPGALASLVPPVAEAVRAAWNYTASAGDTVAATAETAWSYTTSTGAAAASRVVPGMP